MNEPTDADVVEAQLASKARKPRSRPARRGSRLTGSQLLDREMTEAQLQSAIIEAAHRNGWLVMHSRPAGVGGGHRRRAVAAQRLAHDSPAALGHYSRRWCPEGLDGRQPEREDPP